VWECRIYAPFRLGLVNHYIEWYSTLAQPVSVDWRISPLTRILIGSLLHLHPQ